MAKLWKEQDPETKLDPHWTFFVRDCGFTFRFRTVEETRQTLTFYEQKIHPSSRLPNPEWIEAEVQQNPIGYRHRIDKLIRAEHEVIQRWWERLTLYLQENSKREKVV